MSNLDIEQPQRDLSGSQSTSYSTLQRHPEIWFDDGNLVLVAQGTAFRIYRGLMAGQSTVLSDMLISSTSSPEETFEGCSVVHLPDSPRDLAHLLRILLPMPCTQLHTTTAIPVRTFDEVSALIRLAHKYNISQVQDQAPACLQEYGLVTSFAAYSRLRIMPNNTLTRAQYISVVNLARLTDTPSLLPLALFHCAYLGGNIFDGYTREDGMIEYLSEADLRLCVEARTVLTDDRTLSVTRLFDSTPSRDCTQRASCIEELHRVHDSVLRSDDIRRMDALHNWQVWIAMLGRDGAPCRPCKRELLDRNTRERRRIFDRLPEIFGIAVAGWGTEQ